MVIKVENNEVIQIIYGPFMKIEDMNCSYIYIFKVYKRVYNKMKTLYPLNDFDLTGKKTIDQAIFLNQNGKNNFEVDKVETMVNSTNSILSSSSSEQIQDAQKILDVSNDIDSMYILQKHKIKGNFMLTKKKYYQDSWGKNQTQCIKFTS